MTPRVPDGALFEMYSALIMRAQLLTITERVTPEQAADAVVAVFLNGALKRGLKK